MRTTLVVVVATVLLGLGSAGAAWAATDGNAAGSEERLEALEAELREVELGIFDTSDPAEREALDARRDEIIAEMAGLQEQSAAPPEPAVRDAAAPAEPIDAADPVPDPSGDALGITSAVLPAVVVLLVAGLGVGFVALLARRSALATTTPQVLAGRAGAGLRPAFRSAGQLLRSVPAHVPRPSRTPADMARAATARLRRPTRPSAGVTGAVDPAAAPRPRLAGTVRERRPRHSRQVRRSRAGSGVLLPLLGVLGGAAVGVGVALAPIATVAAVVVLFGVVVLLVPRR